MSPLIDVCSFCAARCAYCLHQVLGLAPKKFIAPDTFEKVITILAKEGFAGVHLYMSGEPFYHPHIYDFIQRCNDLKMIANIATKLPVPLDTEAIERIVQDGTMALSLEITLDSIDQARQTKIAPGLKTDVILKNLSELAAIRRRNPRALVVTVRTVVNAENEAQIPAIKNHLAAIGLAHSPKPMGYYMARKATPDALEKIRAIALKSGPYASRFRIVNGQVQTMATSCPFNNPAISVDGDVTVCCHDMLFECKAGNVIAEGSLKKILVSDQYRSLRKAGNWMKLPICKGCN